MIQDPGSLADLRGLVPPDPLPWWPPAPGWFGLAAAALLIGSWAWRRAVERRRAEAYRGAALAEIDRIERAGSLRELAEVLRRTALAAFPRADVASPTGAEWIAWLDRSGGRFGAAGGELLQRAAYRPGAPEPSRAERDALLAMARAWVRDHRREVSTC